LRLAKIYHPDVYKGEDKNRFKKIMEAYSILKNPEKRRDYDISKNYR
jgi:curved DNA-binding protein CbpA